MKQATANAFALLDALEYRKTWDMSGPCIVDREEWLEDGAVVRVREHNFTDDNQPARVAAPEGEAATLTASDVGTISAATLQGAQ